MYVLKFITLKIKCEDWRRKDGLANKWVCMIFVARELDVNQNHDFKLVFYEKKKMIETKMIVIKMFFK